MSIDPTSAGADDYACGIEISEAVRDTSVILKNNDRGFAPNTVERPGAQNLRQTVCGISAEPSAFEKLFTAVAL